MLNNEIGVKITDKKPDNIPRTKYSKSYCAFMGQAREGNVFYTTNEDINCPLARYNLGLEELDKKGLDSLASTIVSWGDAEDKSKALKYLESSNTLNYDRKYIIYFPINQNNLNIEPDIVINIGTPKKFMPILRKLTKQDGDWLNARLSGVGGLCGESTAIPIMTDEPNISLGCGGSRPYGKLENGQLFLAYPFKYFELFSNYQ